MDEDDEDDDADVEASDPSARPSWVNSSFGGWVLSLASPLDDAHDAEDDA